MPSLPTVGSDTNVWGTELNNWLLGDHGTGGTHPFTSFIAADQGFLAWTFDPVLAASSTGALASGSVKLSRINVRYSLSVFNAVVQVTGGGSALTSGQCFAGIYDSTGARVAVTADQSTNWLTAGLQTMALASGPFTLAAGFYWVAVLSNGTTGPTLAHTGTGQTALVNAGLVAATARAANAASGQTALPASFTPSSNALTSTAFWCALS